MVRHCDVTNGVVYYDVRILAVASRRQKCLITG
jgi:hypothetical protein